MIGWILLAVLGLLLTALCVPIRAVVRYRTDSPIEATLRWLFWRYDLTKERPAKPAAKTKPKRTAKKPPQGKKSANLSPASFADKLSFVVELLRSLGGAAGMLVRRLRFYQIGLSIIVATEDAAQTAIHYGRINARIYGVYALADNFLNLAPPQIDIRPNFLATEGEVQLDLRGRLLPIVAVAAVLRAGGSFILHIVRKKTSVEKPTQQTVKK